MQREILIDCRQVNTLHVETAGTLPSLIGETRKYQITDLTLTGKINGTDIRFLREMGGRGCDGTTNPDTKFGKPTDGKLSNLNLSGANIVCGGDYYLNYYPGLSSPTEIHTAKDQISDCMFIECEKLKNIVLPENITSIGNAAFESCTELTRIHIPNNVSTIGYYAFKDCSKLTDITIPKNLTVIRSNVFSGCIELTRINIPNNVISIENSAFHNCVKLTNIIIPNGITSIECSAFKGCTELTFVTIPNSVTSIKSSAFEDCVGLNNVVIPESVVSIGESAFKGYSGLAKIHSKNPTPPCIGSSSFYNANKTTCKLICTERLV
ncbi:MAG: leucine-rich repeat protein [Paludibacteraceae bacterium]